MREFVRFIISRPIMTMMIVCAICLLGLISAPKLNVGLMPNTSQVGLTVVTRYPGVAAEKIHEIITIPLERELGTISELETILSTSGDAESKVHLIFSTNSNIKTRMLDAMERADRASGGFPKDVERPYISLYDPSDRPVFVCSFHSAQISLKELRNVVEEQIKPDFERLSDVSEVFVSGGYEREIQVIIDPGLVAEYALPSSLIGNTISSNNFSVPLGRLENGIGIPIQSPMKIGSISRLESVPIDAERRLSSIASVVDHFKDRTTISRTNGEDRVTLYVQKAGTGNLLSVSENSRAILEGLSQNTLVKSRIVLDHGAIVRSSIRRLVFDTMLGGAVSILILYAFLRNVHLTLAIALILPCSVISTFFLFYLTGVEINVMTLSGLALGAGLLIDNSIVVSDSIYVARHSFDEDIEAIILGTCRVARELVASNAVICTVFLPFLLAEPETRNLYRPLALAVTFSILLSLAFSVTLLPCFLYNTRNTVFTKPAPLLGISKIVGRHLETLSAKSKNLVAIFERVKGSHAKIWLFVTNHPKGPRAYAVGLSIIFLSLPILFHFANQESLDVLSSAELEATVDMDTGLHLEKTDERMQEIESSLRVHPAIQEVSAKVEKWHGTLILKLDPLVLQTQGMRNLIAEFKAITDANEDAFIYYQEASPESLESELNIEFFGDDIEELKEAARQAASSIGSKGSNIDQVILRFREEKEDLYLEPNRFLLSKVGSDVTEIAGALRILLSGIIVSKFFDGEREVDIRLVGDAKRLGTPEDVLQSNVVVGGQKIPIQSMFSVDRKRSETKLYRKNKRNTVTVTVKTQTSLEKVAQTVESILQKQQLPRNIIYSFGDELEQIRKKKRDLLTAFVLSFILIYLILGALFESFSQPLLILVTIPVAVFGVLLLINVFRINLNASVYLGLIIMCGIVVSNAILLVSKIKHRNQNCQVRSGLAFAVLHSIQERARPILMTTTTTIFGMLPMLFDYSDGSDLWRPLSQTVSFGLIFSLGACFLLVPLSSYYYWSFRLKQSGETSK